MIAEGKLSSGAGVEMARAQDLLGAWSVHLQSITPDLESTLSVARGTARISSELGGRFLCFETDLQTEGEEVRSIGRLGFDLLRGHYELVWVSELSSAQRVFRGNGDLQRGGIYLESSERDPKSGATMRSRTVMVMASEDEFHLLRYVLDPLSSDWVLVTRTSYRR